MERERQLIEPDLDDPALFHRNLAHATPDPDCAPEIVYTLVHVVDHSDQCPTQSISSIHSTLLIRFPSSHSYFHLLPSPHFSSQAKMFSSFLMRYWAGLLQLVQLLGSFLQL